MRTVFRGRDIVDFFSNSCNANTMRRCVELQPRAISSTEYDAEKFEAFCRYLPLTCDVFKIL